MTRNEWKAFSQALRAAKRYELGHIKHGFTHWSIKHSRNIGFRCYPSIIRDRSTCSRIDDALAWSAHYRQLAKRERHMRRQHIAAARACIADAREVRLSGSIFHQIAA